MNEQDRKIRDEWINQIALENSDSESTSMHYRDTMEQFCEATKVSLSEIANEWRNMENLRQERIFKERMKRLINLYQGYLGKKDYTKGTIGSKLTAIYSFFNKYLDVRLRAILPPDTITYHNKPIEKHEIQAILGQSNLRNSLAYYLLIQGGLRPHTIARLKYKDIKEDFEGNVIPLRVKIRKEIAKGKYGKYYTFVGEELSRTLTDTELEFVVLHEMGHIMKNHLVGTSFVWLMKSWVIDIIADLLKAFYVLLSGKKTVEEEAKAEIEREADQYAVVVQGQREPAISTLLKLSKGNVRAPTHVTLDGRFPFPIITYEERIEAIRNLNLGYYG